AAGMTNFRFDLWFPNAVDEGSSFLMKLVDIPEGEASEALINVNSSSNPAIAQGTWLQFDIPFTELESNGLSGSGNIQQVVIDLINSGEVYIDNIYFYNSEGGSGEDITPPVITLNGDAMIDLIIGDMFTDPGATASDNVDGDITSSIVVGGDDVDISTVGTYLITYDVSDAAGNAATQVSRTVVVSRLDGGLITNGDFADGSQSWIIGVDDDAPAPVVTENGNSFYSVNVEVAGNPFDVNLSQKLEIIEGETYTLTFDAWSDRERDILAGIGLSGGDFSSTTETISINTNRQTYSVTVTANGFGATDARVLFDLGAAAGLVNIDNVSLILGAGGGGATNGCDGELVAATSFPVDFEGCETFPSEINFGAGISSGIVANPFKEGINTSDFAFQVIKEAGADFFAGVQNNFAEPFDLNATPTFKMKVYSTKPNVVFRFEVAQDSPDVGNPVPAFRTIENANEWVELSFEFPNAPAPTAYFRLVIKPDNDEVDGPITEDGTYYIDDITLE
ncbi:MAG TPA: immunoglobulin-like domain-containing protein, partial [Cyclobacteriaceae bacterium]